MLPALVAALLSWSPSGGPPHSGARIAAPYPRAAVCLDGSPSLREQMMAYIKVQQDRGIELTPEQKAMIAHYHKWVSST